MADPAPSPVKSALRTLDIIEFVVAQGRPVNAQEISSALVIPVSSMSYLLATLVERGYLARDVRRYRPGEGLHRLLARSSTPTLKDRVAPLVRSLRAQLNETASFFVQRGWAIETLVTETSEHALRYATHGGTLNPMHAFAAGKAILASLPAGELNRFFREALPLERFTPATLTTEDQLRAEIERTRDLEIARTNEEFVLGIQGIGRALILNGELLGAFSLAIPTARFNAATERSATTLLRRTVALLQPG